MLLFITLQYVAVIDERDTVAWHGNLSTKKSDWLWNMSKEEGKLTERLNIIFLFLEL